MDALNLYAGSQACQDFAPDLRQHRVGYEGVHHTRAAFQFCAALADQFGNTFVESEWNFVVFANALLNPRQLSSTLNYDELSAVLPQYAFSLLSPFLSVNPCNLRFVIFINNFVNF